MDKRKQKSPQEIILSALRDKDLLFHGRKMWCVHHIRYKHVLGSVF